MNKRKSMLAWVSVLVSIVLIAALGHSAGFDFLPKTSSYNRQEDTDPPVFIDIWGITNGSVFSGIEYMGAQLTDESEIVQVALILTNYDLQISYLYEFTLYYNASFCTAELALNTVVLADGLYDATLQATDMYNNTAYERGLLITIENNNIPDNDPPVFLDIWGITNGSVFSGTEYIGAQITDESELNSVDLTLTGCCGSNISYVFYFTLYQNVTTWIAELTLNTTTIINGTYEAVLEAVDEFNNVAFKYYLISVVSGSNATDTNPPVFIDIAGITNGSILSGTHYISAILTDESTIDQVSLFLIDLEMNISYAYAFTLFQNMSCWIAYLTLDTTLITDGTYEVTLEASDIFGNIAYERGMLVTVNNGGDNDPPVFIDIWGLSNNTILSGTEHIGAQLTDVSTIEYVRLILISSGETNVSYSYDLLLYQNFTYWIAELTLDTTLITDGAYEAILEASDVYNNVAIFETIVTIFNNFDSSPPEISGVKGLSNESTYSGCQNIIAALTDESEIQTVMLVLLGMNQNCNTSTAYIFEFQLFPIQLSPSETLWIAFLQVDTTEIPNGMYQAVLVAIDEYNNYVFNQYVIFIENP